MRPHTAVHVFVTAHPAQVLACAGCCKTLPVSDAEFIHKAAQSDLESVRQEMIQRINQVRRENGAAELPVNEALMDAAQNCSAQGFRKHDQQYEWTTLAACGWPYGGGINLTYFSGASNLNNIAQKAVSNWVNSPGHFQTMLREDATCLGVGVSVINHIAYEKYVPSSTREYIEMLSAEETAP